MTDGIRPALTPEEWKQRLTEELDDYGEDAEGRGLVDSERSLRITYDSGVIDQAIPRDEVVRILALANHALPDSHPNKFTRADVEALRRSRVFEIDPSQVFDGSVSVDREGTECLRSLAARIEALLPPEGA